MLYEASIELVVESFHRLRAARESKGRGLSYRDVAQGVGVSEATIHNFVNHKDPDNAKLPETAQAIRAFLDRELARDESGLLRIPFAETRQAETVLRAHKFASTYGKLVAVVGNSGFGKTRAIQELQQRDRTLIVVTAWSQMGAAGLLKELCLAIGQPDRGQQIALMKRLRKRLEDSGRVIVIDDAHTLKFAALDMLRYVYDQTGVGLMLCGISSLERRLIAVDDETEQLASRLAGRVFHLPELNAEDVHKILVAGMGKHEADRAFKLIEREPDLMASARRLGNVLEMASAFANRKKAQLAIEHLEKAIQVAA